MAALYEAAFFALDSHKQPHRINEALHAIMERMESLRRSSEYVSESVALINALNVLRDRRKMAHRDGQAQEYSQSMRAPIISHLEAVGGVFERHQHNYGRTGLVSGEITRTFSERSWDRRIRRRPNAARLVPAHPEPSVGNCVLGR